MSKKMLQCSPQLAVEVQAGGRQQSWGPPGVQLGEGRALTMST